MSDQSNEDIISKPILPILFDNIREELTKNRLFLLEMKVNPEDIDSDRLDSTKIELNSVYKNFDVLDHQIVFNLFEFKENKDLVSLEFKK